MNNVNLSYKTGLDVVRNIIAFSNERLRYGGRKKGSYRIQRTEPKIGIPPIELLQIVKQTGSKIIKIIPPGALGAGSGKFNTYVMRSGELEFSVVFGQGSNKGHDFETETYKKLKNSQKAAKQKKARGELHKILLKAFNISPSEIEAITHVGHKNVKRPMTEFPTDVGSKISDIDFVLKNGAVIHVSLKNRQGKTFANSGYSSAFIPKLNSEGNLYFINGEHQLDKFVVQGCGINKEKVASGINDYITNSLTPEPFRDVPTDFDPKIIKSYLAGAYGYGYWYLRPKMISKGPGYRLENIQTAKDALNKVGEITNVVVSYPYWTPAESSKQTTIKIYTTQAYYKVEIRNSKGKVHPNELKVKIVSFFD